MKLAEVKKKYKNQWVLAEVLREEPTTKEPLEVKILSHSISRRKTHAKMRQTSAKHLLHLFCGPIPKKGYAVAF